MLLEDLNRKKTVIVKRETFRQERCREVKSSASQTGWLFRELLSKSTLLGKISVFVSTLSLLPDLRLDRPTLALPPRSIAI